MLCYVLLIDEICEFQGCHTCGPIFANMMTCFISGEGIPDLLLLLVQWAQKTMEDKLTYVDEVQVCTNPYFLVFLQLYLVYLGDTIL